MYLLAIIKAKNIKVLIKCAYVFAIIEISFTLK